MKTSPLSIATTVLLALLVLFAPATTMDIPGTDEEIHVEGAIAPADAIFPIIAGTILGGMAGWAAYEMLAGIDMDALSQGIYDESETLDGNTSDDTVEGYLQGYSEDLNRHSETSLATGNNLLANKKGQVWSDVKAQIAKDYLNGKSVSEAKTNAEQVVDTSYTNTQINYYNEISSTVGSIDNIDREYDGRFSRKGFYWRIEGASGASGSVGTTTVTEVRVAKRNITLYDGTVLPIYDAADYQGRYADYDPNDYPRPVSETSGSYNVRWDPLNYHDEAGPGDTGTLFGGGTDEIRGTALVDGGSWSGEAEYLTVDSPSIWVERKTGETDIDGNPIYETVKVHDTESWNLFIQKLDNDHTEMVANVDPYTEEVWTELQNGNVSASELMDASTLMKNAGNDYEDTGWYGYASISLATMGLDTDLNKVVDIRLEDSGNTSTGMLFVENSNVSTIHTGTTYDPTSWGENTSAWFVDDNGLWIIREPFTVTAAYNQDTGEQIDSWNVSDYNPQTTDPANFTTELNRLNDLIAMYENMTVPTTGGGTTGDGTSDPVPTWVLVGGIAVLVGVVILRRK